MAIKKNLFFALIIVIACLLIAEITVRFYFVVSGKEGYIWIPDDYSGRVHSPNCRFVYKLDYTKEFTIRRKTNSLGLIGEEISVKKPENVFRILVLGDSFTEGLQVREGKNFCEQLQFLLNQKPNPEAKSFQVLNAGVSSYSPINEYLYFKRELVRLNPNIVILQLFVNDVFEDNKVGAMSIMGKDGLPLKISNYFTKRNSQNYIADSNSSNSQDYLYRFKKYLLSKSKFMQFIVYAPRQFKKKSKVHREMSALPEFNDGNQFFIIQENNYFFQNKEFRNMAMQNTERYILEIRKLAEQHDAVFIALLVPPEAQLNLETYGYNTRLYFFTKPNFYLNERLEELCSREHIFFLDLISAFEEHKAKNLYFDIDGHLTENGHKVVSEAILNFLIKHNLLD
jgi:lysophospholipase L1-like esterase